MAGELEGGWQQRGQTFNVGTQVGLVLSGGRLLAQNFGASTLGTKPSTR